MSRDELLNKIQQSAYFYEKTYHGCSRCVLKAIQDHLDLGNGATLRASTPLAAGVTMRGETCGALLGGLLAVGIATAQEDLEDADALTRSLASGFRFVKKVEKELGSTNCTRIQEDRFGRFYNIADPQEYESFKEAGGYEVCSEVAGKIARIAAEHILDYREKA